jgi:hypothetical protein
MTSRREYFQQLDAAHTEFCEVNAQIRNLQDHREEIEHAIVRQLVDGKHFSVLKINHTRLRHLLARK